MSEFVIINADVLVGLRSLPSESVDCVFTSPPYWGLRDYGKEGQIGLEKTFQEYVEKLCDVFDEVKRVLKPTGTCFVNLGDSYSAGGGAGNGDYRERHTQFGKVVESNGQSLPKSKQSLPDKSLCNVPARFSIGMQDRGWILRNQIIWHKPSCMPCSVKDRFTVDFETVWFFTKNKKYFFEQQLEPLAETSFNDRRKDKGRFKYNGKQGDSKFVDGHNTMVSINSEGRNMRCVWEINPEPYKEAHFACFPTELVKRGLKAGCPKGGIVLDPFVGSGTTLFVAQDLRMKGIGIELNEKYIPLMKKRLLGHEHQTSLNPNKVEVVKL